LIVHETRHNEEGDPGHTSCDGGQTDPSLEDGSGHAYAAMYLMWVYKYSLYDSPEIREEARSIAASLLDSRFCPPVTHSDSKVQEIVDELLE